MCHHIPTDEREAFAERLREMETEADDPEAEPDEVTEDPEERPDPMATPTDD